MTGKVNRTLIATTFSPTSTQAAAITLSAMKQSAARISSKPA
jgi:hypothetical protein